MNTRTTVSLAIAAALALSGCSLVQEENKGDFTVSGSLATVSLSNTLAKMKIGNKVLYAPTTKTITHVMAINPEASNPERFISEISKDGTFSLPIVSGKPYVLVFIANNSGLTGNDMIAGILKLSETDDLDTLAPKGKGSTNVGTVTVDGNAQKASVATAFDMTNFLGDLGLSSSEAKFIGAIDDLSLRAANPDVDGNGVIDANEGKSFSQDWHIRANTRIGAGGPDATFADITDKYLDASGTSVATMDFILGSAYAVYPSTFSTTDTCSVSSGVSTSLKTGCAFRILDNTGVDVTSAWTSQSFSGAPFPGGTTYQWGPDYDLRSTSTDDLPGSKGSSVMMEYTMEAGKILTFSHVTTRPKATLTQNGAVVPFLKLNTTGGKITSVDYKWMKLENSAWTDATTTEVDLIINDNGGFATFYTTKGNGVEEGVSFNIPKTSASGNIAWTSANITVRGSTVVLANLTPSSFCSSAVSYDDKLGLRIFAGGLAASSGVTACY